MNRRLAALALTVFMAAGCSADSSDEPQPSSSTSTQTAPSGATGAQEDWLNPHTHVAPILAQVVSTDPVDVGRAVATIACTWSPVLDTTETDALHRAAPLLTDEYATNLQTPKRGASQNIFVQAAAAKAVSVPTVQQRTDIADAPPSTATTQYLAYAVTWVWTTAQQKTADVDDTRIRTVYVVLERQADGSWLASNVDAQDQQAATPNTSGKD